MATSIGTTRRWLGRNGLRIYGAVAFAYLFLPIAYIAVFSFNQGAKSNITWRGFTTANWANPCGAPDVCDALGNSLKIGVLATVISTVLGTMVAFALGRHRFRGRGTTNLLIFLPMATPEVVMAASLLTLFLNLRLPLGYWTIVAAHVMFSISFVVVTVKARLAGFDSRLEEAAMDLYATEWQTFRRVTLPNVKWALLSGVLLCNARAMGEFGAVSVVSGHIRGQTNTMPLHVEILYNEYQFAGAFAVAALLALLGLVTLAAKAVLERLTARTAGEGA